MRSNLWISVLSAATLVGCTARVGVRAHVYTPPPPVVTATVETAPPPPPPEPAPQPVYEDDDAYVEPSAMVYVNPDVQVIEDYDYPVFYTDGLYWRYDGGVWYSSSWHDRGWAESRNVPVTVRRIDRPTAYVHYHGDVNARPGQPGYRNAHPTVTVHAGPAPRRGVGDPRVTAHATATVHEREQPHATATVHEREEPHATATVHEHEQPHATVHEQPHATATVHETPKPPPPRATATVHEHKH